MDLAEKIKIKKELELKGIKMSEDIIELSENIYHKWRKELGMSLTDFIVYQKREDESMYTKILGTILLIITCVVGIAIFISL